ncbi:MAG TPA: GNAT family N-acetyltransferase [Acidobacteriota bacterium]|nr:GNAT family N-acetyltransferase [Acidobacteriota bacterium]
MILTTRSVETQRLLLRPFAATDLECLVRINSDPDVMQFIANGRPWPEERTRLRLNAILNHWTRHGFGLWATIYKEENALIGFCGLQHLEQTPEVEVGYRLDKKYWGKGLATEGAAASIQYGFEMLKLQRIVAVVHPNNRASRRVLEKCGMRFEKMARYYEADLAYYSIFHKPPQ